MKNSRINYTQVVWEITQLLQGADSLQDALRKSLSQVVSTVGAQAGTIWFYNAAEDKRIYPSFWIGGADLTGLSLAEGEGIAGTVVKEGRTTVVKDCQQDARWAGRFDAATGFVTRSMICVPLINKVETIGCIQIINKVDGSLYNDEDVDLTENLAMLTAIAIGAKGLHLGFTGERAAAVSLKDVSLEAGGAQLLCGVTLDVREGELLAVLGESGCGKRELLDVIGGLVHPTSGEFLFDGRDYAAAGEKDWARYRRTAVSSIFRDSCLFPTLTAEENVTLVGEMVSGAPDAREALARVGLLQKKDELPEALTAAQRQRVAIARALVKKPRVILADEITEALDREAAVDVLASLQNVAADGATVLMTTNNENIARMANRVIRMKGGAVAEVVVNHRPVRAKELEW